MAYRQAEKNPEVGIPKQVDPKEKPKVDYVGQ